MNDSSKQMGRPGDGILAEHDRRAALTNHKEAGEMTSVDPSPARGENADWRFLAACRDVDPELFFPTATAGPTLLAEQRRALAVCAGCPVVVACRSWAVAEQPHGVAGGLTEDERRCARRAADRSRCAELRPAVVPAPSPWTDRAPVIAAGGGRR